MHLGLHFSVFNAIAKKLTVRIVRINITPNCEIKNIYIQLILQLIFTFIFIDK